MYDKQFWDNVYTNNITPWVRDDVTMHMINAVKNYITPSGALMLDYGCGSGGVAAYFRAQGAVVDLAEISDVQIMQLKKAFPNVNIFSVEMPTDVCACDKYDYVLCLNVLHHINPNAWSVFLDGLYGLVKPGGKLIVSGWDDTDYYLKEHANIALATQRFSWSVTDLIKYISPVKWNVQDNVVRNFKYGDFEERSMRFYCLVAK